MSTRANFLRRLRRHHVRLLDERTLLAECDHCGRRFFIMTIGANHPVPRGYPSCPNCEDAPAGGRKAR